ncbi:von Willebrand factor C and EGF domain-containing protein isoform X2 [Microcaecilia unicolor]|uniref:von Willebrand factor C and EGF domain-containing protein isoform X2 n=1 Tax=Microcaecilia unicolor TaxID=1415580 RepID=A0A6P7XWU1_9AMPH|nr:von Willebrand factor C and EGF domain-containing protein isoform X2 [Microcaecilia unicolor]
MFPVLLLEVSSLFIFFSETQGKAYSGRKKPSNSAAQRHRFGPHVCHSGLGTGCCPGWAPAPGSGQCILPLCSFGCGNGFCIAPNVCSCRDGQQGVTCPDDSIAAEFLSEDGNSMNIKGSFHSCVSAMCEQSCLLIAGIPICSCFIGYTLGKDGRSCYGAVSLCGEYGCDLSCNHGGCEHVSRVCPLGFTMIEMANGITCADINECTTASCEGLCVNTEGGYVCECRPGMQLSTDRHGCVDIDECSESRSPCQQRCKNSIGSYRCSCGPGFHLHVNGHSCLDINECRWLEEPLLCQHSCHNTFGSFFCSCRAGFLLSADRVSCDDIDECLETETLCALRSCVNTLGSYRCACPIGFMWHDRDCRDVDECSPLPDHSFSISSPCQQICTNTAGSYLCSCHKGYELALDGHTCQEFPGMMIAPAPILSSQQYRSKTLLTPIDSTLIIQLPSSSSSVPTSTVYSGSLPFLGTSSAPDLAILPTFPSQQEPVASSFTPPSTSSTPSSMALPTAMPTSGALPSLMKLPATSCFPLAQNTSRVSTVSLKDKLRPTPLLLHPPFMLSSSQSPSSHPYTSTTSSSSCLYQGTVYNSGSHWTETGCLDCSCQEGHVFCEDIKCNVSCSHPVFMQQKCCPVCDGCLYEGVPRMDGEVFSLSADNCTVCICLAGNVTCISPECPLVTCPHPFLSECCLQCPAECVFHGQIFPHGAEFSQDGDKCRTCVCQNGDVECSFTPCPVLECPREEWLLEVGHCCFRCQKSSAVRGCPVDDNGVEFPVGQIWSPGDPCEICICQSDGSVTCKRTNCLETCPHPIVIPGQCCPDCSAGCSYHGKHIQNNETFLSSSDPCLTCICLLGSVACSPVECTFNCTYPFHAEGECCPICHDCTYEGRKVLSGQTFLLEKDHCTQCTCQLGEVKCEEIICQHTCTDPYIPPGECCSTCEECLYEGQILEDGGSYISKADPCVVCHCDSGDVQCEWRGDSCPTVTCHQPLVHTPGECCPTCSHVLDSTFPENLPASYHLQDKYSMKGSRHPRRHTSSLATSIASNPSTATTVLNQHSQLLQHILRRNTLTPRFLQKITTILNPSLPSPITSGPLLSSPAMPNYFSVPTLSSPPKSLIGLSNSSLPSPAVLTHPSSPPAVLDPSLSPLGVLGPSLPPIIVSSFPTFHMASLQSTSIHPSSGISSFEPQTTVRTPFVLQATVSRQFIQDKGMPDALLPPKIVPASSLPTVEVLGSSLPPATTLIPLQAPKMLHTKGEPTVAMHDGELLGQKDNFD